MYGFSWLFFAFSFMGDTIANRVMAFKMKIPIIPKLRKVLKIASPFVVGLIKCTRRLLASYSYNYSIFVQEDKDS